MPKVIQVRDVPDDVHAALVVAAKARGLSLTRFVLAELDGVAKRAQVVRENATVVRQTQNVVRGRVTRDAILSALHEGRGD